MIKALIKFIYGPEDYLDSSGRISAVMFFLIGILLFLALCITKASILFVIGILFILFFVTIYSLILLALIFKLIYKIIVGKHILSHLVTLLTMIPNFFIAYWCIIFIIDDLPEWQL